LLFLILFKSGILQDYGEIIPRLAILLIGQEVKIKSPHAVWIWKKQEGMAMKFRCPLIVVQDIQISQNFYEQVLEQKVKFDFGENIVFEGDFSIQQKKCFASMLMLEESHIHEGCNHFELYFEEEDMDRFIKKLKDTPDIRYIHPLLEHPWGQRVIRFYDPDLHIIEVGESMIHVVRRFISQGFSIEETAIRTQHPITFVRQCL